MIVSIVSGMVFSRTLSVADYGTYLQTFLAYDFAAPFLTLGLPSALYYFLPRTNDSQKGLVLENMLLLLFAASIFCLILVFGGSQLLAKRFNNPYLLATLKWMYFYPLYTFPVLIASTVWVVQNKIKLNAIFNVFTGLFLTILLILGSLMTKSYNTLILIRVLVPLLFFPMTIYLIFKFVPGKWDKPRISSMWSMLKFSIPLGLSSVIGTITIQLSSMIVALMTSPVDFAVYANGAKEVPLIGIITGSISVVIMAEMANKIKEGDLKMALELFRKSAIASASFLIPIMVFLMIYADSFIYILYSNKYTGSVTPFRIYLFSIPIRIVYYSAAFIALGKSKEILFRSVIDLGLTAIFSFLLLFWFGINGAPIALILTMFIWTVPYNLYTLAKEFNCKSTYIIPFSKVGKVFLISLIAGVVSSVLLFIKLHLLFLFIFGFTLFIIVYGVLAFKYISEFRELTEPFLKWFDKKRII
jgi:O-antigen/teichoic acid export membrane protein